MLLGQVFYYYIHKRLPFAVVIPLGHEDGVAVADAYVEQHCAVAVGGVGLYRAVGGVFLVPVGVIAVVVTIESFCT